MAFCDFHYYSAALGKQTAAYVLLPETGTPPYATLYLLHGLSDDYTIWQRRTSIERYVENLPLIVVMADGGRGFYADAVEGYAYGKAIGEELPARIEKTFPAKSERDGRALAGLSMGGYGAVRLALTYPDRFCAASSLSGAMAFGHKAVGWDDKPIPAEFQRILGADPVGGPNDLFALAKGLGKKKRPALRVDCGTEDFLFADNQAFHAYLKKIDYSHQYKEYPGAHTWAYWDEHIQDALPFLCKAMGIEKAKS